ncbi:MAG: matrixin family metalloprotease [Ekhidna sp.]|nr:matrixin family metalloprotease [Ekhidna sp.]
MKKILLFSLIFIISLSWIFGQVLYDNGPIIISDSSARFSIQGNKWSKNSLTYFFQNGTNDISGSNEQQAVRDAFELWSCVTPLNFTKVSSASSADIVILWGSDNHGDNFPFDGSGNVLAHAFFPPPNGGAIAGDIHFDEDEKWTLKTRNTSSQPIDLVTVAAHEIGHSLGLNHSSDPNALMFAYYSGSHRFLSKDDIQGIQKIYGGTINSGDTFTDISNLCFNSSKMIHYSASCDGSVAVTNWTASPNVTIVSSNNSSVTVRAKSSHSMGNGWVKATLSNGTALQEDFDVGIPNLNYRYYLQNISLPNNSSTSLLEDAWNHLRVACSSGCGDLNGGRWQYSATGSSIRNGNNNTLLIRSNLSRGSNVKINYRSCNACGCSGWRYSWFAVIPGGLAPTGTKEGGGGVPLPTGF